MGYSVELKPNNPFLPQLLLVMELHHSYANLQKPICAWCLWKPAEGIRSSELELQMVVSSHWVLRTQSGPFEEHTTFLAAKPPP